MVKKRRRHSAACKFRIALEALEGGRTIRQLSREHEVHANMIRAWKRQLLEDGPNVFARSGERKQREQEAELFDQMAAARPLRLGRLKIFNTDQGAQFTADAFTACLLAANIQVSMDGRGRALDNVFCERLWRSVKCEIIYPEQHDTVRQLHAGLSAFFDFYNHGRPHQSPEYRTPADEHFVLCSEPAACAQMHLIIPIWWSNDWGQPYISSVPYVPKSLQRANMASTPLMPSTTPFLTNHSSLTPLRLSSYVFSYYKLPRNPIPPTNESSAHAWGDFQDFPATRDDIATPPFPSAS